MIKVLHISSECYPAAKAGGMGDVVGALPKYLPSQNVNASVIIPMYRTKWIVDADVRRIYIGNIKLGHEDVDFTVYEYKNRDIKYPFYFIDIPGKFDRADIYLDTDGHGYKDEPERNISFQRAVCQWLTYSGRQFDILHCHDHMTGLIPFMIQRCFEFESISKLPCFFTIHNGQYRGIFEWDRVGPLLPQYNTEHSGLLDWDNQINSLATAIKCAWAVNTVSPTYMEEIVRDSDTLTPLYNSVKEKLHGIINGVDTHQWDPEYDNFLNTNLTKGDWNSFKASNKKELCEKYGLNPKLPLIGFIGRFADQKGADLLKAAIEQCLSDGMQFSTMILGTGDKSIENDLLSLRGIYPENIAVEVAYNEKLSRLIYAATDFLIMPSRFEPCGLNQLFAMRYGSVPIVTAVGGLCDTVPDIRSEGNGILIPHARVDDIVTGINRSIDLYNDTKRYVKLRSKISALDFSWDTSAKQYAELYNKFLNQK
jgi:starch synthase